LRKGGTDKNRGRHSQGASHVPVEPGPIRRIVTGNNEKGRSAVIWDGPARQADVPMGGSRFHCDFWIWNQNPAPLDDDDDAAELGYDFPGPPGGGHLRIVQGRGRPSDYSRDRDETAEPLHDPVVESSGRIWSRGGRDAFSSHMHKTQTIDYAVLLDGGRELELDTEIVRLHPGDFVVDVGAWHQWHTPSTGSSMSFDMFAAEFVDGADGLLQGSDPVMVADASLALPAGVRPIRRVVVGDTSPGKSELISDGASPDNRFDPARPGFCLTRLWVANRHPAPLVRETLHLPHSFAPPKSGSIFRALTLPPDASWQGRVGEREIRAWFSSVGGAEASTYAPDAPHPYMQKTRTLDFCLVVEGTATLVLDSGETAVNQGEVAVVRGSNHAWANRTDAPAIVAVCMHDAS
jgi:quercetin dioxygenase-like cupin family protein